jgi:hypothetical protein
MNYAYEVAAGAAWLDENRPGWVSRIDLDELDMRDNWSCILGQEWMATACPVWRTPFHMALQEWPGLEGEAMGFDVSGYVDDIESDFEGLTEVWRELIKERRAA